MVAYTSYLRVFVPLSAYPDARRRVWEQYIDLGTAPTRAQAEQLEQELLLDVVRRGAADLSRLPQLDGSLEHALVERRGDSWLVCPCDITVRTLRAVVEAPDELGFPLDLWYATPALAREAERRLRDVGERNRPDPEHPSTVQTQAEPWGVPGHWFALFATQERLLEHDHAGVRLRYRTTMRQARRRTNATLRVIRGIGPEHELAERLVDRLVDLGRWLATFDAASMVELDYGGLARLVDLASLELDDSPGELQQALGFARENDLDSASEQYQFIQSRWEDLRQVHRWN